MQRLPSIRCQGENGKMSLKSCLAIIALALTIAACKKDSKTPTTLTGKWELESSFGGWGGRQTYPPGNGNTLNFTGNTYIRNIHYGDTTYQVSGSYLIFEGNYCEQGSKRTVIQFDGGDAMLLDFTFTGSTISMGTPECIMDGGTTVYRKISNQ